MKQCVFLLLLLLVCVPPLRAESLLDPFEFDNKIYLSKPDRNQIVRELETATVTGQLKDLEKQLATRIKKAFQVVVDADEMRNDLQPERFRFVINFLLSRAYRFAEQGDHKTGIRSLLMAIRLNRCLITGQLDCLADLDAVSLYNQFMRTTMSATAGYFLKFNPPASFAAGLLKELQRHGQAIPPFWKHLEQDEARTRAIMKLIPRWKLKNLFLKGWEGYFSAAEAEKIQPIINSRTQRYYDSQINGGEGNRGKVYDIGEMDEIYRQFREYRQENPGVLSRWWNSRETLARIVINSFVLDPFREAFQHKVTSVRTEGVLYVLGALLYRSKQGKFPKDAAELSRVVKFPFPPDPWSKGGEPYLLTGDEQRFQVYSRWLNGKDEQGKFGDLESGDLEVIDYQALERDFLK